MIIKDVRLNRDKDSVTLSARCKVRKIGWNTIYFSLAGAKKADYIFADASPFAAALLIPAMRQGEDLIIKGSISKRLLKGMEAVQNEVLTWDIDVKHIAVHADKVVADSHKPTRTATTFSGGVDSFYTYLKHKQDLVKANRVDSFILVSGFDMTLKEKALWDETYRNIAAIAKTEGIELLAIKSNINAVLAPLLRSIGEWHEPWDYIHGGCLAAVGLMLRGRYQRVYIPSTHSVAEQIPWGSNLAIDKHWSTEKLTFVHDGSETTRLGKVQSQIAKSPVALKHLRVCYMNQNGRYNCGRCDKCLRTMVNLYIAGALEQAETFPHTIDTERIANTLTTRGKNRAIFHTENLEALRAKNQNPELQAALEASLRKTAASDEALANKLKDGLARKTFYKAMYVDYAYAGGHVYAVLYNTFGTKLF